jgi:uncharacterized membrane protein YedE/YeeE
MIRLATYFLSGLIFAIGLVVGGMTRPQKIIGFLDVFGNWDKSLAGVMLGAVLVHSISYRLIMRRSKPVFAPRFLVPTRNDIDASLVIGASLFGIGWGLGGYCPGPALVATGALLPDAAVFVTASIVGHWLCGRYALFARGKVARSESPRADADVTDTAQVT